MNPLGEAMLHPTHKPELLYSRDECVAELTPQIASIRALNVRYYSTDPREQELAWCGLFLQRDRFFRSLALAQWTFAVRDFLESGLDDTEKKKVLEMAIASLKSSNSTDYTLIHRDQNAVGISILNMALLAAQLPLIEVECFGLTLNELWPSHNQC
jgi:hypothetical protein